jgi:two-component system, OmpR family, alkaline phosphatase synthesis response regulator PhoP
MNNSHYRILLVDDEPDILEFLGYNLRREGFHTSTARNGKEAIAAATKTTPHLIVLDVMMPGMDGMETCRELRTIPALKDTIIAFLTARGEDYSQMAGFEAGADDYISKPIKPGLLISRVKALLRRYPEETQEGVQKSVGGLVIDRERYLVIKNGEKIVLPKKEFELLFLLTSKPNKVFTREEIFSRVWGNDVVVGDRTIDVHIRKLREKLGSDRIQTVKGIGYKFEE